MGLFDGLKGGQGFYWGAPLMDHQQMQRPQPISLPAGGRGTTPKATAAADNKYDYLPGDSQALYNLDQQIEVLQRKLDTDEISEDEFILLSILKSNRIYSEQAASLNKQNWDSQVGNNEFQALSEQPVIKDGGFVADEQKGFLTAGDLMNTEASNSGLDQYGRISIKNWNNFTYKTTDLKQTLDSWFKNTGSHSTVPNAQEIVNNAKANIGNKEVLSNIKITSESNRVNLSHAGINAFNGILSDEQAYKSLMVNFASFIKNGGTIPEYHYSDEEVKARSEDEDSYTISTNRAGSIKNFRPKLNDVGSYLQMVIHNEEKHREISKFDVIDYTSRSGSGSEKNESLPMLDLYWRNDPLTSGMANAGLVDFDGLMEGERVNLKQPFVEEHGLGAALGGAYNTALTNYEINSEKYLNEWAQNNGIARENLNSNQIESIKNTVVTNLTRQSFYSNPEFQKAVGLLSDQKRFDHVSGRASAFDYLTAIFIMSITPSVSIISKMFGNEDKIAIKTMPGVLADMSFQEFTQSSIPVKFYRVQERDFKGTSLEKGAMALEGVDRFQILGTSFTSGDLETDGKKVVFMNPSYAISGFQINGETVDALKGGIIVPNSKKTRKSIRLKWKNKKGEQLTYNDFNISELGASDGEVTKEMIEMFPGMFSGWAVGDKFHLIPATIDATQIHGEALANAPGTKLGDRMETISNQVSPKADPSRYTSGGGK